jgi:hypothetical protein
VVYANVDLPANRNTMSVTKWKRKKKKVKAKVVVICMMALRLWIPVLFWNGSQTKLLA